MSSVEELLKANEIVPRLAGMISFVSSMYMLVMTVKRRESIYHRLIFGMSFHLLIFSIFMMYGTAAIPSDNSEALGNVGNRATCTLQGFFIYVSGATGLAYYASFSVYSYIGVLHNFENSAVIWVEKWIHSLVNIYPISTGLYFLLMDSYQNNGYGYCYVSDDASPWLRGFWICIVLLFPTIVMATLFLLVKKRQKEVYIKAKTVAQQVFIYLFSIYWIIVPGLIVTYTDNRVQHHVQIGFALAVTLNYCIFPFWCMLGYYYFSSDKSESEPNDSFHNPTNRNNEENINFILRRRRRRREIKNNVNSQITVTDATESLSDPDYSFNIFDGTNATGQFSEFIHDGDSEDEAADNEQTKHWNDVQDHV